MKKLAVLAIRNILRNRRRSIITATAIAFGAFIMLNALSYVAGLYQAMVGVVLDMGIGHVQIHRQGYTQALDDRTVSSDLVLSEEQIDRLLQREPIRGEVDAVAKRVIFSALLGNGVETTSGLAMGISPEVEGRLFGNLSILAGRYLEEGDRGGVLISERVRRVFGLEAGDRLTVAVQSAEGGVGTAEYEVIGVFRLATEFNFRYVVDVLVHMDDTRALVGGEGLTEVALLLRDVDEADAVIAELENAAGGLPVEVHGWTELGAKLLDIASYMGMGMRGWTGLIFIGIALSILNIFLMSVYERTQEIGILKAIGMKQRRIRALFLLEAVFLSLFAATMALVASMVSVRVLSAIGLPGLFLEFLPPGEAVRPTIRLVDAGICLLTPVAVSCLAGLFPAWRASRMDPVAALRYE